MAGLSGLARPGSGRELATAVPASAVLATEGPAMVRMAASSRWLKCRCLRMPLIWPFLGAVGLGRAFIDGTQIRRRYQLQSSLDPPSDPQSWCQSEYQQAASDDH